MAKTQSDLISAVLSELNRIGAGQTPPPEDIAAITPRIGPILADAAARRVVGTIDPSAISDAIFPDLVRLVAQHVGPLFGRPTDPTAIVGYETRLREVSRYDKTADPFVLEVLEQLEVYQAGSNVLDADAVTRRLPNIFGELSARGVVTVYDTASLQNAIVPDLTRYVAASLANPPRYQEMQLAEQRLRMIRNVPSAVERTVADYF